MTKWDIERAVFGSDLPPLGRLIVLALLALADSVSGEIPPEHQPSLSRLEGMTGMARSTLAAQLNALEASGWVARRRPPVAKARVEKARTTYVVRVPKGAKLTGLPAPVSPDIASPGAGLARPNRAGIASPGAGPASPGAGLELVREPDRASPGAGHVSTASTYPPQQRAEAADRIVMEHTGATASEAAAIVARVRNERQPRSLAGLIRRMATDGDLAQLLTEQRGATRRQETVAAIAAARQGPPCQHGERGGAAPHPATGEPLCALCRRIARLPQPNISTREATA